MHLNNYHNPEEKIGDVNSEKVDLESTIQILTKLLNDLQNSKLIVKKNEKNL
jgi:hypothetical protein